MAAQSAAIPFRIATDGTVEVLLITSRSRRRWILPKGKVPSDMLPHTSAAREALEEAGVIGVPANEPVADYEQEKVARDGSVKTVMVRAYALPVSSELQVWPESRRRKRRWMALDRAIRKIHDLRVRRVLQAFREQRACTIG